MHTHAEILIGHMRLNVANLERSLAFYCGLIGLERGTKEGNLIMLCPGKHHHIVLEPPHRKGTPEAPFGHTGMYHFSFLYPERRELGRVIKRFIDSAYDVDGALDYGMTQAVYFRDPDGIPVELYTEYTWSAEEGSGAHVSQTPPSLIDLESFLKKLH